MSGFLKAHFTSSAAGRALFRHTEPAARTCSNTSDQRQHPRPRNRRPRGASVPQARVAILNDDTGFTRQVDSDENGYYVFPNLPLGSYTVTIEKEGSRGNAIRESR